MLSDEEIQKKLEEGMTPNQIVQEDNEKFYRSFIKCAVCGDPTHPTNVKLAQYVCKECLKK